MPKSTYLIPVAILLAGLVLSIAVYVVRSGTHAAPISAASDPSLLRPVTTDDHILGSPQAPVTVVEYSDMDCEYCKKFTSVMEEVMTEYGAGGKVAWVYRHFPLVDQHINAAEEAEASECVASLGGPTLFWRFMDGAAARAPGASQLDPDSYAALASSLGVSASQFEACRDKDTFVPRVSADFANAIQIGATSAPYSVILIQGADPITVDGYVPYDSMKQIIDTALSRVVPPTP
jgi:protein-disulfide isomerase